jgi:predicted alpha/beta superfamily hydrolase
MSESGTLEQGAREWSDYTASADPGHTVVGTLRVLEKLWSPQLRNERDLLVYLPPSYEQSDRRYPVIYMHDGQNLFDSATSFAGEWEVDQTMEHVSGRGLEAIVVGIPNTGEQRLTEYSPFVDERMGGGGGDAYLDFIVQTVKPIIDQDFRTRPEREGTAVSGSSMGGLISLYAFFRHPAVFGFVGAMSPALWFGGRSIFPFVTERPFSPGRIYLDVGTNEGREALHDVRRMKEVLARKGYVVGRDLLYVVEMGGRHEERAWARRLGRALHFMLGVPVRQGAGPRVRGTEVL